MQARQGECAWLTPAPAVSVTLHFRSKGKKEGLRMRSIVIASLFILFGTAAQAEIVCTHTGGCWDTGRRIILVDSSYVRGQPYMSHRNGSLNVCSLMVMASERVSRNAR